MLEFVRGIKFVGEFLTVYCQTNPELVRRSQIDIWYSGQVPSFLLYFHPSYSTAFRACKPTIFYSTDFIFTFSATEQTNICDNSQDKQPLGK